MPSGSRNSHHTSSVSRAPALDLVTARVPTQNHQALLRTAQPPCLHHTHPQLVYQLFMAIMSVFEKADKIVILFLRLLRSFVFQTEGPRTMMSLAIRDILNLV